MTDIATFPVFYAVRTAEVTLMGTLRTDYPMESGNCFSVETDDGRHYRIVNFVYENMKEAFRRGTSDDRWRPGVEWPLKCLEIGNGTAIVHDLRIPTDWYAQRWCECCCPHDLLPMPQRLTTALRRESGEETVKMASGITVVCATMGERIRLPPDPSDPPPPESRKLSAEWTSAPGVIVTPFAVQYGDIDPEMLAKYANKVVDPARIAVITISADDP